MIGRILAVAAQSLMSSWSGGCSLVGSDLVFEQKISEE